jgi:AraC-like DNA-binding protein
MALRIFDHLFVHRGRTTTGCVHTPEEHVAVDGSASPTAEISPAERQKIERRSMLARLSYRCGLDPIMSRTSRLLQADSCLSIQQLAAELGVSERSLSNNLRSALGQNLKSQKQDGT